MTAVSCEDRGEKKSLHGEQSVETNRGQCPKKKPFTIKCIISLLKVFSVEIGCQSHWSV